MNSYEEKMEAKRERYENKAEKLRGEAKNMHARAHAMAAVIPFGQPILVGHHSEKRDRCYRAHIYDTFGKAFATMDKADYYEQKAACLGTGGISSDDPDALDKLRHKLEVLKARHELMKNINAAIRKGKTPQAQITALLAMHLPETEAAKLITPDCCGRIGVPAFRLQNSNANICRVEQRIRKLEHATKTLTTVEQAGDGYIYREDVDENRVMFLFDSKPDAAIRTTLKRYGFRWSPSRTAWVRMLNTAGLYAAKCVKREFGHEPANAG